MIKKTYSIGQNWFKEIFSLNFFFSNIVFPLAVLVFYFLSFQFILSNIFNVLDGVNFNFARRSLMYFSYLAVGSFLVFVLIYITKKGEKIIFDHPKEKISSSDLLYLLLPLTPVIQYVINNQSSLTVSTSIYVVVFFVLFSAIFTFTVPVVFEKVGSNRILIPLGLSFAFSLTNMALLTQSNNWFENGSLIIQWLVFGGVFLATWILHNFNGRSLLRLIILVFFAANTIIQLPNLESWGNQNSVSIEDNGLLVTVDGRALTTTPNVYLLIYDAYVSNETMLGYGIDNSAQEEFLVESGFTLYPHTYSVYDTTLGTMSRVLNASTEYYGNKRRAVSGDGVVHNLFKSNGYQTYGLFPIDYFFREGTSSYDLSVPDYKTASVDLLPKAILMGEFRFDVGFDEINREQFVESKQIIFEEIAGDPVFIYMHSNLPSHSQNSGVCRPDETERYEERLANANIEMQQDINIILENDPGAIILIAGDHGAFLTQNCYRFEDFDVSEITRLDIQDRVGTFLAIRWPTQDFESYDDITVLQDVFPAVFAYIYSDASILESKIAPNAFAPGITVRDGIIVGGLDDGEPLFMSEQYP